MVLSKVLIYRVYIEYFLAVKGLGSLKFLACHSMIIEVFGIYIYSELHKSKGIPNILKCP